MIKQEFGAKSEEEKRKISQLEKEAKKNNLTLRSSYSSENIYLREKFLTK